MTTFQVGDIVIDRDLTEIMEEEVLYEVLSIEKDNRVTLKDLKTGKITVAAPAEMVEIYEEKK